MAALRSSTSHKKDISALPLFAKLEMSLSPLPPTPMPATYNISLGALYPLPKTNRGTIVKAAAAIPAFLINFLLEGLSGVIFFIGMGLWLKFEKFEVKVEGFYITVFVR